MTKKKFIEQKNVEQKNVSFQNVEISLPRTDIKKIKQTSDATILYTVSSCYVCEKFVFDKTADYITAKLKGKRE